MYKNRARMRLRRKEAVGYDSMAEMLFESLLKDVPKSGNGNDTYIARRRHGVEKVAK